MGVNIMKGLIISLMDNLFKTLLIIILLAFLYLYYENSNNDRYFLRSQSKRTQVFDKKTGTVYRNMFEDRFESINYIDGTVKNYWGKTN